jgi:hypothetical protein
VPSALGGHLFAAGVNLEAEIEAAGVKREDMDDVTAERPCRS